MSPKNMFLWYIDYLELQALEKYQIQGGAFSKLFNLSKNRSSKKNSIFINPLLTDFVNQGRLTLITEEIRSQHHTQTNFDTNFMSPICFSRVHSSFLKIIYSPLRGLNSPPLSIVRWYFSLNSKPPQGVTHFPLGPSHVYMRDTC